MAGRPKKKPQEIKAVTPEAENSQSASVEGQEKTIEWCQNSDCTIPVKHVAHEEDYYPTEPKAPTQVYDRGVTGFGVNSYFTPPEERIRPSQLELDKTI